MQRSGANRLHCALERGGSTRFPHLKLRVVWPFVADAQQKAPPSLTGLSVGLFNHHSSWMAAFTFSISSGVTSLMP